jgi:hypothetical protein
MFSLLKVYQKRIMEDYEGAIVPNACQRFSYLNSERLTAIPKDLFPNEQNFDLDKSRQTFHHSLKEHHKISNIPKFRCEML